MKWRKVRPTLCENDLRGQDQWVPADWDGELPVISIIHHGGNGYEVINIPEGSAPAVPVGGPFDTWQEAAAFLPSGGV